jgi:predicted transcriptional regulator
VVPVRVRLALVGLKSALLPTEKGVFTGKRGTAMGKPTKQELEQALNEAQRMREQGQDPHHLAKALLNLNYQSGFLVKVLQAAENYLNSGMAEAEHTQLVKAIETARAVDALSAQAERPALGL